MYAWALYANTHFNNDFILSLAISKTPKRNLEI